MKTSASKRAHTSAASALEERVGSVTVHPSGQPAARAQAFQNELQRGRIPGWWLYDSEAQAKRWLAYHELWSPARKDASLHKAHAHAAAWLAEQSAGRDLYLIGLGSGGGHRDAALLEAAAQRSPQQAFAYTPVDSSQALVLEAAQYAAERLNSGRLCQQKQNLLCVFPLVLDLERYPSLPAGLNKQASTSEVLRCWSCLGLSPNLPLHRLLAYLRRLLRAEDGLILSANLAPRGTVPGDAAILRQYNNPAARHWYAGALSELGLSPACYRLRVIYRRLNAAGTIWRILAEAQILTAQRICLPGGLTHKLLPSTRLRVFQSTRFTLEAFQEALLRYGFSIARVLCNASGEEAIFCCRRLFARKKSI